MSNDDTLVSVVIPAYNAQATLDETLSSVRAQTHQTLEIIVVDDGSTDGTHALAERHAAADARIRVLHQANAGVAAARNAGWQHSRAEFIAFVDADDLWAPTKIERQLLALIAGGPRAGLAYCWTARLDASGRVTRCSGGIQHAGDILPEVLRSNFIGSGSNVMVRRQAALDVEGYDRRLRDAGAEGCEDWLFNSRVAETYRFTCVPEVLVGYRYLPDSMSANRQRMLRSYILACRQMIARRPEHAQTTLSGLQAYCAWLMREAIAMREPRQLWALWYLLWRENRALGLRVLWRDLLLDPVRWLRNGVHRLHRSRAGGVPFAGGIAPGRRFLETTQP